MQLLIPLRRSNHQIICKKIVSALTELSDTIIDFQLQKPPTTVSNHLSLYNGKEDLMCTK